MAHMGHRTTIESPDDPALARLCAELARRADALDSSGEWPAEQLEHCRRYGVFRWFVPREWGGCQWSDLDVIRGYLRLSAACLSTTFVITQPAGACRRLLTSENRSLQERVVPAIVAGEQFASVGIAHLTTSRRHLDRPVLTATRMAGGFILNGVIPWVTGGDHAEWILTGATCEDGRQILALLPTDLTGVSAAPPARLVGLASTHTGQVHCQEVRLDRQWLLAGPKENVLSAGGGAGTGGLATSALAIGLAAAAIEYLAVESERRPKLAAAAAGLRGEHATLQADLWALAAGQPACSTDVLRSRANSLVLRASHAALSAAKGAGYIAGHPAGRWCREALFFLVWSCPQPVMHANLCEWAGLDGED